MIAELTTGQLTGAGALIVAVLYVVGQLALKFRNGSNTKLQDAVVALSVQVTTLVEKVEQLERRLSKLQNDLQVNWDKYDTMQHDVTRNTVRLDEWKHECPIKSGRSK